MLERYGKIPFTNWISWIREQVMTFIEKYGQCLVPYLTGHLFVCLIPFIHIGIIHSKFWVPDTRPIDRNACTCTCFDAVMRGTYEESGRAKYKHLYFNATRQTFCIWTIITTYVLLAYESVKYLARLARKGALRHRMLVLYLTNIYPLYYGFWNLLNYFNEDFYRLLKHDVWFDVTELMTSYMVLHLADQRNDVKLWKISVILCISIVHILQAGRDQFIVQVLLGEGKTFQIFRNVGLFFPDIAHVLISSVIVLKTPSLKQQMCTKLHILYCACAIVIGLFIGQLILPFE